MTFRIIGFNDEVRKSHGPAVRFHAEDQFDATKLPTEQQLRAYAEFRGYLPRTGRGIHPTKCEPVYLDVPTKGNLHDAED